MLYSDISLFIFISNTCIITFSIYLCSTFFSSFRATFCCTNPDNRLIWMIFPQLTWTCEGLLHVWISHRRMNAGVTLKTESSNFLTMTSRSTSPRQTEYISVLYILSVQCSDVSIGWILSSRGTSAHLPLKRDSFFTLPMGAGKGGGNLPPGRTFSKQNSKANNRVNSR
jgi:hypothetical protein